MKKVFVDAGAYDGDSIQHFRRKTQNDAQWEIHAFEADSRQWPKLEKVKDITLHKQAVWVENGYLDFYHGQHDSGIGSSVYKEKESGNLDKDYPHEVSCIDFSEWIIENVDPNDYVVVKMDIEGAEFDVIPHMIANDSILYIRELWCEFHPNKIRKYTTTDKLNLIRQLKAYDHLLFKEWH